MSRAFVKEPDGDAVVDDTPELPVSPHPNHVTPKGLTALRDELDGLSKKRQTLKDDHDGESMASKLEVAAIERRQRYLAQRIDSAIEHDPQSADPNNIGFGATVDVEAEDGEHYTFSIVGEDEADPARQLISWTSPLAGNLFQKECGDEVRWVRPRGDIMLYVTAIRYGTNKTE